MNILLVNPSYSALYGKMKSPVQMHLGLGYIASVLEQNKHNVDIVDMDAERLKPENFIQIVRGEKYHYAGFTVTTPTLFSSLELARYVKQHSPATRVIFGGIHPAIKPYETINSNCVDIVVKGEGEIALKEVVETLNYSQDLSDVKGLVYKKDGKIYETPPRPLIENLDSLPFPARHLFKTKRYTYPDSLYKNVAPMLTSRGCPGMCTYCDSHQIFKRTFRARGPKNVVDEVEYLTKTMGTKEIHIWDDNFTTNKNRVFSIKDEIVKRNIKVKFAFPNGVRADFLDKEIMGCLKEMGAYSIAIGVESGSQEVLKLARKGINLERIDNVFTLAKKMNFETWAFFIIGLPGENTITITKTIDFAKKLNPDVAKFHILKPYPGTEVYEYLRRENLILTEDYNKFGIHTAPVHRLEALTPRDMVEWQKRAYLSFYLKPRKIVEQIFRIKTFNRFILNLQGGIGLLKLLLVKNE